MRWQKMAHLVLRRVGLCVGQNQMCHLWAGCLKILVRWKKIKTQKGSASSVGILAVQMLC